jgi:hypothetical protein
VLKGVQSAKPDRGLLVPELLDGPCVAVGDLALLAELELVAAGRRGLPDLVAGRPHLPKGHARTDARSGQDQHGADALQQRGAGVVLQLQAGALQLLDLGGIRHVA